MGAKVSDAALFRHNPRLRDHRHRRGFVSDGQESDRLGEVLLVHLVFEPIGNVHDETLRRQGHQRRRDGCRAAGHHVFVVVLGLLEKILQSLQTLGRLFSHC
jgi:hypothetical protein